MAGMNAKLVDLYHKYIATAFDRQLRLSDFLSKQTDDPSWEFFESKSTLLFGKKIEMVGLALGSHAIDDSWMWSWNSPIQADSQDY